MVICVSTPDCGRDMRAENCSRKTVQRKRTLRRAAAKRGEQRDALLRPRDAEVTRGQPGPCFCI